MNAPYIAPWFPLGMFDTNEGWDESYPWTDFRASQC